jgi:hypothetical protein
MVTYVNDLRLSELATGEGSGTWGTTTNTNLELIGEALGYGTEQSFSSDADATTTIGDGVSDPARAMYFKVTSAGSLTATRTLTIAPNTVSRVMFIENATTGSQSIAISQGSGASVTILTGKTAVVYLDGAGATAAVVDAMSGVDPGVTDTLTEVLVAGNTSGGTNIELSTTDKVQFRDAAIYLNSSVDGQLDIVADTEIQIAATTVDLNGNLDVSGTALVTGVLTTTAATVFNGGFASNADSTLGTDKKVQFRDSAIYINSSVDGQLDIVADTEIQIAATTVDLNGNLDVSGTALVTGVLTTTAATVFNGGFASNAASTISTADNTDTLTLISTDADAAVGPILNLYRNSSSPANNDLVGQIKVVARNNNSQDVEVFRIDNYIVDVTDGSEDCTGGMYQMRAGTMRETLTFGATEFVINDDGLDYNFRVESDTLTSALFVDGGTGNVTMQGATTTIGAALASTNVQLILNGVASKAQRIKFAESGVDKWLIGQGAASETDAFEIYNSNGQMSLSIAKATSAATFSGTVNSGESNVVGIGGTPADVNATEVGPGYINLMRDDAADVHQIQLGGNGVLVGSIGNVAANLEVNSQGGTLKISTIGTERYGFDVDQFYPAVDGATNLGIASKRFDDLFLSGGVYLGGTGAANLLEDYEEGLYTVAITCGTSGTITVNSSFDQATYTKVGRLVTVTGLLAISAISSPVGSFSLSLPFTAAALAQRAVDSAGSIILDDTVSANCSDFIANIVENTASITIRLGDATDLQFDSAQQVKAGTSITTIRLVDSRHRQEQHNGFRKSSITRQDRDRRRLQARSSTNLHQSPRRRRRAFL